MLPGKTFTPEDILRVLRRRFWLVLIPFAVTAAITAAVARQMPDLYRSETLILVVPQRVPESYVKPTVTTRIEDRLHSISQQILSRTRLERVIQDFNLYADERNAGIMEDIVEQMRRDINVDVVKGDAFRVSYKGREPRTVMRVTERLASLFIEENLRDREVLAEGTNQFLESQLEDARRRLIEQERRLEVYRREHSGELPSQLESNLQVMQNTQMQVQSIVESINRDRDRRLLVERQLEEASLAPVNAAPVPTPSPAIEPSGGGTASEQLNSARAQLKVLELRFKPDHPDIGAMRRRVRDLEQKAEAEELAAPVSVKAAPRSAATAGDEAKEQRLTALRSDLEQLDRQISQKLAEEKRLRSVTSAYQSRLEAAPTRETELVELTRDYAGVQQMYANLLAKKEESKIAANLERRQIGEQFKLLDPARLPEKPTSPNRSQINFMGMFAGLAFGILLVALVEYRDKTFHLDDEVSRVLSLPVLAVVPTMVTDAESRVRRRRRIARGLGLGATVAACVAVVVYTFVR